MSKLSTLIEAVNAAKVAFKEQGLGLIKEEAKSFFAANPDIKAVSWTQYAPYFNDGEACEFSVNEIHASTGIDEEDADNSFDPETDDAEDFFDELYYGEGPGIVNTYHGRKHAGAAEFTRMLANIPEDVMRDLFGNDSKVLITAEGINIADHDHD